MEGVIAENVEPALGGEEFSNDVRNNRVEHKRVKYNNERLVYKISKVYATPLRESFGKNSRSEIHMLFFIVYSLFLLFWCFYNVIFLLKVSTERESYDSSSSNSFVETGDRGEITSIFLWGRVWSFDAMTCNSGFLEKHYENYGSIVVYSQGFVSFIVLIYSILSMRNSYLFNQQLMITCSMFTTLSILYRILDFSIFNFFSISKYNYNLIFWLIPDAIFIVFSCIKKTQKKMSSRDDKILYCWGFCMKFAVPLIMIYGIVLMTVFFLMYKLEGWFYWPAVSFSFVGSFYVLFSINSFFSMYIPLAVDSMLKDSTFHLFCTSSKNLGIFVVGRYHFNSVCYHATWIAPRLQTWRVMNEPEFKEKFGFPRRFVLAQVKLHNLTPMITALNGTSHSESLRVLMRHFTSNHDTKPQLDSFHGFQQAFKSSLALVMSTNNLLCILLWIIGLYDTILTRQTWFFYIFLFIPVQIATIISDNVFDTALLYTSRPPPSGLSKSSI